MRFIILLKTGLVIKTITITNYSLEGGEPVIVNVKCLSGFCLIIPLYTAGQKKQVQETRSPKKEKDQN
jgi:hypothetical protein